MLRKLQISRFVSLEVSCVARANLCHLENKTNLELIVPLERIYAHLESFATFSRIEFFFKMKILG